MQVLWNWGKPEEEGRRVDGPPAFSKAAFACCSQALKARCVSRGLAASKSVMPTFFSSVSTQEPIVSAPLAMAPATIAAS